MATRKKSVSFEKKLSELEDLVQALESGGLSLDDSLKAFEKGVKITRECQEALSEAEQKVQLLTQNEDDGSAESQSFNLPVEGPQ